MTNNAPTLRQWVSLLPQFNFFSLRLWILILTLALSAALRMLFFAPNFSPFSIPSTASSNWEETDFTLTNFTLTDFNEEGGANHRLQAKVLTQLTNGTLKLTAPTFQWDQPDHQTQQPTYTRWTANSKTGEVNKAQGHVKLIQDVVLTHAEGQTEHQTFGSAKDQSNGEHTLTIKSDAMNFWLDTNVAETKTAVEIFRGTGVITAIGFTADLVKRDIHLLKNVHGLYDPTRP